VTGQTTGGTRSQRLTPRTGRLRAWLLAVPLGVGAFSGLTVGVLGGATSGFDRSVLLWMHARGSPALDHAALKVTALGDTLVVLTMAAVAGSLLWLLGRRGYAALLARAVIGAAVLTPVLKLAFARPRPGLFEWRTPFTTGASYPSGHAAMSAVLLAALAYIVYRLSRRRWVSMAAALLAAAGVALVSASRLYLGVHYPSDVIAGSLVGLAWAAVGIVATDSGQAAGASRPRHPAAPGLSSSRESERDARRLAG